MGKPTKDGIRQNRKCVLKKKSAYTVSSSSIAQEEDSTQRFTAVRRMAKHLPMTGNVRKAAKNAEGAALPNSLPEDELQAQRHDGKSHVRTSKTRTKAKQAIKYIKLLKEKDKIC